jgi:hypothetical protein
MRASHRVRGGSAPQKHRRVHPLAMQAGMGCGLLGTVLRAGGSASPVGPIDGTSTWVFRSSLVGLFFVDLFISLSVGLSVDLFISLSVGLIVGC